MKLLLTAISGLLMGLTTAPFSASYLAWIALIPLWLFTISHKTTSLTPGVKNKLKIIPVSSIDEVISNALVDTPQELSILDASKINKNDSNNQNKYCFKTFI